MAQNMRGIFLDLETNGLSPLRHQILEIALQIVDLSSGVEEGRYESVVFIDKEAWSRSDPASLKVNGFTYDLIQQGKAANIVASEIISLFKQHKIHRQTAVFIGQNPSFDRAFFSRLIDPDIQESLQWPYYWLDLASMYWAECLKGRNQKGLPWEVGFSKDQIASVYHLPPEAKPHRAMNGVSHLLLCYKTVIGFVKI